MVEGCRWENNLHDVERIFLLSLYPLSFGTKNFTEIGISCSINARTSTAGIAQSDALTVDLSKGLISHKSILVCN